MITFRKKKFNSGALDDFRPWEARKKDYLADEVMAFGAVDWTEKSPNSWRKFPIYDQGQDGSCVAHATATELGVNNFNEEGVYIDFSKRDLYSRRANKPDGGMAGADANNLAVKYGMTLESLLPTSSVKGENDTADRKPSFDLIAKIYRPKNWLALPFDMDKIAQIIDGKKAVKIFIRGSVSEWDRAVPQIDSSTAEYTVSHAVAIVDRTFWKGQRAFIIDDSWGNRGLNGQRILTEDWIAKRTFWASYFVDLANLDTGARTEYPKYRFTIPLKFGSRGEEVIALQHCLAFLQDKDGYLFPLGQKLTGFYGGLTRKAVERFQDLNSLPITGAADTLTIEKLNQTFA